MKSSGLPKSTKASSSSQSNPDRMEKREGGGRDLERVTSHEDQGRNSGIVVDSDGW